MIHRLHYITHDHPVHSHVDLVELACQSGVNCIQLRIKNQPNEVIKECAVEAKKITDHYGRKLIINDHVDIARTIGATGVHLGKDDMDPEKAREIVGNGTIIGGTANTVEDIRRLSSKKVDYIGLGPFRFTQTKEALSPTLGLTGYREIKKICKKENITTPIIAIGGILIDDLEYLFETGIHGVAIASAISGGEKFEENASGFIRVLKKIVQRNNYFNGVISHSGQDI